MVTQPLHVPEDQCASGHARSCTRDTLEAEGVIAPGEADAMIAEFTRGDGQGPPHQPHDPVELQAPFATDWSAVLATARGLTPYDATFPMGACATSAQGWRAFPEGFNVHPQASSACSPTARAMAERQAPLDWGMGETLAYGTLARPRHRRAPLRAGRRPRHVQPPPRGAASAGPRVRGVGSTCRSRTSRTASRPFEIIDSVLSEYGVLGFEYGYSHRPIRAPGRVGGAVRRLRQRRAGGDRPVHRRRRGEVGPRVAVWCCCCRTATRGRGPSTRRRGPSASCSCAPSTTCRCACRTTPGADLPPAAPADAAAVPQAADRDDARRACCATRRR